MANDDDILIPGSIRYLTVLGRIRRSVAENSPGRPGEIRYGLAAVNEAMSYPQSYVDTRLDRLAARGLVARRDDSWAYELTDRGSFFLRGAFDASALSANVPDDHDAGRWRSD